MHAFRRSLALAASFVLLMSMAATTSAADPGPAVQGEKASTTGFSDNIPSASSKKQFAMKQRAQSLVLAGQANPTGDNQVVKVPKGQFVELAFEGADKILTLLGQFGAEPATHTHGALGTIDHGGDPGPLHNQIPQPDRSVDNTTIWAPDFSRSYYEHLLFDRGAHPSMANWYLAQSAGRYTVDGYVSDWIQLPNNEAAYGSNYCGSIVCTRDVGRFVEDEADTWWTQLVAQEGSVDAANAFLAQFDVWDRYDFDEDGDFNEPDGYIDHFQAVHAGDGEETGGGAQGTDAIWSHRSYVNSIPQFAGQGPTVGGVLHDRGGAQIGDSAYWIGDYTVEPENGGVGVFVHEFGHDLNLPDEYDTNGNVGGAENSTAWWTTWSQGSYGTVTDSLGMNPVSMTAWEKYFLGWLDYDTVHPGDHGNHKLAPIEASTKKTQALVVDLPDVTTSTDVGTPFEGGWFYNSRAGNDLDNTMTRQITLPAGEVTASFKGKWRIEPCWDYAYLQISTDGKTFENVHTSASAGEDLNANGQDFGEGITGISGTPLACDDDLSPTPEWVDVDADLSDWAGQTVWIRFRYWTDGAVAGDGISIDNLAITGQELDGAETDPGWTYDGFLRTNGTIVDTFAQRYFVEYRAYYGYDLALKLGPYNFTNPDGNFVEHFPYQDGMLVWFYDETQFDNNVSEHPGKGLILPIDAHPTIGHWSDGSVARPRIQAYDATFGRDKTDPITLHSTVLGTYTQASQPAVNVFDDSQSYYVATDPADGASTYKAGWNSVDHPHSGTKIRVVNVTGNGGFMHVQVN